MKTKNERIQKLKEEIENIEKEDNLINNSIYIVTTCSIDGTKKEYLKWDVKMNCFTSPEGYPYSNDKIRTYSFFK